MSLFSKLFKSHVGDECKKTIELLLKWEKTHFKLSSTRYNASSGLQYNGVGCYSTYRSETGETISLSGMVVHQEKQDKSKGFFDKMKEIIDPAPKLTVPSVIAEHRKEIYAEIQQFKNNVMKYEKLSEEIKSDSFFTELDHIFNSKLKFLYNELLFCKFEKLGEKSYLERMRNKVKLVCRDMKMINTAFFDYMYALTNIQYENNAQDLESIKIRVNSMKEAVVLAAK